MASLAPLPGKSGITWPACSADKRTVRVLYLSQYFPPEPGAPAARVYELSRSWVRSGMEVTVLTAFPNHPTGHIPPAYRGRVTAEESVDGVRVRRVWVYASANKGYGGRIANYVSFALSSLLLGLCRAGPCDVLIATSPQFLVALTGYLLARLKRVKFVLEVRDLWPASIVAVGAMVQDSVAVRVLERLEKSLYRRADHIVVVTDSFKREIVAKGIAAGKISVVKNGVDLTRYRPGAKPRDLLAARGLEGKLVASYIGTVGMAHGVGLLLEAARRLASRPDLHIVVVGEGAERADLEQRARREGLTNITFVGGVPRERVCDWIRASDVCAVLLRDKPLFRTVIPSKMFEIMACGCPVILAVDGEARSLLEAAGAGVSVRPGDVCGFCAAVQRLLDDPDLRRQLGARGRAFVAEHFDREILAGLYGRLLENIHTKGGVTERDPDVVRPLPDSRHATR